MKQILLIIILLFNIILFGQSPISLTVTGDCLPLTETYAFDSVINGKNNYIATIMSDGETVDVEVGFDGTKWVVYQENDMTDIGFQNTNVPAGLLPPNTGWTPHADGCINGTLIISGGTSLGVSIHELDTEFSVYQNSSNSILIKIDALNKTIPIAIYNILGKKLVSEEIKNSNTEIDMHTFPKGIYLVKINNTVKKMIFK